MSNQLLFWRRFCTNTVCYLHNYQLIIPDSIFCKYLIPNSSEREILYLVLFMVNQILLIISRENNYIKRWELYFYAWTSPCKLWWMNLSSIKSLVNFYFKSNSSLFLIFVIWANWTDTLPFLPSYVGISRDEGTVFQHFRMNIENSYPNIYQVIDMKLGRIFTSLGLIH